MREKIIGLDELARWVARAREAGQTVVHCHGVFDLLHIGHVRYFERARELGDLLIVTATPDRFVDKGAFRPAFPEALRLEAIAALGIVDRVALNRWPTAEETLRTVRPDLYVKGAEFREIGADPTGKMERERAVAEEVGCRIAFVDDLVFSSSQLINRHLRSYPAEVAAHLEALRPSLPTSRVAEWMVRVADTRVLVVGETVSETTVEVDRLGLGGRDASPQVRPRSETRSLGGAPVLARTFAGLAGSTRLLTLGPPEELANELPGVACFAHPWASTGPGRRRWVDAADGRVWLTAVEGEDAAAGEIEWLAVQVAELAGEADLVVFADQGRGAIVSSLVSAARASGEAYLARVSESDATGPALQGLDLALRLYADPGSAEPGGARAIGRLERGGQARWFRDGRSMQAPSFVPRDRSGLGAEAFAAAFCLATATGAEPELTLLAAQAARMLAAEGDPTPSRQRLQKQLTSMLK